MSRCIKREKNAAEAAEPAAEVTAERKGYPDISFEDYDYFEEDWDRESGLLAEE